MSVERVANLDAVGRFREATAYFGNGGDLWNGGDQMTNVVIFDYRYSDGVGGSVVSCTSSGGWYFATTAAASLFWRLRDGTNTTRVAQGGGASFGLNVVILRKTPTDAFIYKNGVQVATQGCIGWTPDIRSVIGAQTVGGVNAFHEGSVVACMMHDSFAIGAGDVPALDAQLKANLANGRDLRTGLGALYSPEYYFDAADIDWINGTWTDRVAGGILPQTGNPERFAVPGRVL